VSASRQYQHLNAAFDPYFQGISTIRPVLSGYFYHSTRTFRVLLPFDPHFQGTSTIRPAFFRVFLPFDPHFQGISTIRPALSGYFYHSTRTFRVLLPFDPHFQSISTIRPGLSGYFYHSVSQRKTPQSEDFSIITDTRGNIRLYRAHGSKLLEL
jgi:hypothetical protein